MFKLISLWLVSFLQCIFVSSISLVSLVRASTHTQIIWMESILTLMQKRVSAVAFCSLTSCSSRLLPQLYFLLIFFSAHLSRSFLSFSFSFFKHCKAHARQNRIKWIYFQQHGNSYRMLFKEWESERDSSALWWHHLSFGISISFQVTCHFDQLESCELIWTKQHPV